MSSALKAYHDAARELEVVQAEYTIHPNPTTAARLETARQHFETAREAWEQERATLTTETRLKLAHELAKADRATTPPSQLDTLKNAIRSVRTRLKQARDENKLLYEQLKANREQKRTLNAEYNRLRAQKQEYNQQVKP